MKTVGENRYQLVNSDGFQLVCFVKLDSKFSAYFQIQ